MGGHGDGCIWQCTRPINCGDRSAGARDANRCDGQVVGRATDGHHLSGKNQRVAAVAAASVDLSTGEKVKILYAAADATTVGPAPESLIRPAEDKCCG